jgi:hypothetical protein
MPAGVSKFLTSSVEPSLFVPAQQVRTEQPSASPVDCRDWSPVNDREAELGVRVLQFLDGNRHRSQDNALWRKR